MNKKETEFIEYDCNNCQGCGCTVCGGSGKIIMPKLSDKIEHISFSKNPSIETITVINKMVQSAYEKSVVS